MTVWNTVELRNLCSRLSSGKNIAAKDISEIGPYPVYGGNGIRGYTDTYNFDGECAIIGRQGAKCGNVRYFKGRAYMTEHAVVTCANDENNTRFLAYLLGTMQLGRLSGQSAQPGLSVKTLGIQEVNVPDLLTQRQISCLLGEFDDLIEHNKVVNKNLEEQARAIFDRMISSSNSPYCSLSEIAELNPKRTISKGTVARCIDMAQLSTSTSFPNGWEYKPFTGGMRFCNGDTLLARITPCLENGKTAYINFLDSEEVAFGSTEYVVMSSKGEYPNEFFYCLARYPEFVDYAVKNMNGSSGRQRVSAETIGKYELPKLTNSEMREFASVAPEMFDVCYNNALENIRLANLRDTLLPHLMSGEIDVSNVGI